MAKTKQNNFRLGLYSSANGKIVVVTDSLYHDNNDDDDDDDNTYVEYRRVIPPPGKKHRYIYRSSLPVKAFRRLYPMFVDKCVVE